MLGLSRTQITIIIIASFLLLGIPITIWAIQWQWQIITDYNLIDHCLFLITQTGTAVTYAFITCVVLATLLSMVAGKTQWLMIFFTALILQVGTQVVKTGLKSFYKEPRPYTNYLVAHQVDLESFYQQSRAERKIIVMDVLDGNTTMPVWLKQHWAKETGYSFPSGHVAFAICWLVVFVLFLPMNRQRDWLIFSAVFGWSALMIISRIRLGMHYPVDVLVSTIYVPVMCLLYVKMTQHKLFASYLTKLVILQNKINEIFVTKKASLN